MNCKLLKDGYCKKYGGKERCEPSSLEWFDEDTEELEVIEPETMCYRGSIFGNEYFKITAEQLEALKQGKVLFSLGEYGSFIALEVEAVEEAEEPPDIDSDLGFDPFMGQFTDEC